MNTSTDSLTHNMSDITPSGSGVLVLIEPRHVPPQQIKCTPMSNPDGNSSDSLDLIESDNLIDVAVR